MEIRAQGVLTDKYLHGIPEKSRATRNHFLKAKTITPELIAKVRSLNEIAAKRSQSLAQMALAWVLRQDRVTTVLIGASRKEQIEENVRILDTLDFFESELMEIEEILK